MEIIAINLEDFNSCELKIHQYAMVLGRECLRKSLEKKDEDLAQKRDKEGYRHKGKKGPKIRTIMGVVTYQRNIYLDQAPESASSKRYLSLLDQAIGKNTIGKMSANLVEKAVEHCADVSFRKTSNILNTYTSQTISHQAIWDMVQVAGKRMADREKEQVENYRLEDAGKGRVCSILFEEADGVHLSIQKEKGEKRRRRNA